MSTSSMTDFYNKFKPLTETEQTNVLNAIYKHFDINIRTDTKPRDIHKTPRKRNYVSKYKDECISYSKMKKRPVTNDKYPRSFDQIWFTAGDTQQFFTQLENWTGPLNTKNCILSTFSYLFTYVKKAVFVSIRDNALTHWVPFSNANFKNTWGDQLSNSELLNDKPGIHKFKNSFNANGCIVRAEWPVAEGDHSLPEFYDMILELCKQFEVPDCDFFINEKDFPLLRKDNLHPYPQLWTGAVPHTTFNSNQTQIPIFSQSTHVDYKDIPWPTTDDWRFGSQRFFAEHCTTPEKPQDYETNWSNKISRIVFRGGPTGCGLDTKTNPRIRAAQMAHDTPREDVDIGLTLYQGSTPTRPRINFQKPHVNKGSIGFVNKMKLNHLKKQHMSRTEQSKYKFVLHIDGNVSAFRLTQELYFGSCILRVSSNYSLWYDQYLRPWIHYVPVKSDLSDFWTRFMWCKTHDTECKKIAQNALHFAKTLLHKNNMLRYIRDTITLFSTTLKIVELPKDLNTLLKKQPSEKSHYFEMRKFHNFIKSNLYLDLTQNTRLILRNWDVDIPISLLDLACGKGGDIAKWNSSDIDYVYGIDIHEPSIKEAIKRLRDFKSKHTTKLSIHFENANLQLFNKNKPFSWLEKKSLTSGFQLVSCMMALNYFFESEQKLRKIFEIVQRNLSPDGYFFGTFLDGKQMFNFLKNMKSNKINNKYIEVENFNVSTDSPFKHTFGQAYSFKMKDPNDLNQKTSRIYQVSKEWLAPLQLLEKIAIQYGLTLVHSTLFKDIRKNYIKRFELYEHEQTVSNLYSTFVFQKTYQPRFDKQVILNTKKSPKRVSPDLVFNKDISHTPPGIPPQLLLEKLEKLEKLSYTKSSTPPKTTKKNLQSKKKHWGSDTDSD